MKTCNKCGECKPLNAFNRHAKTKDGYRPQCKQCKAAELRDWRGRNKDEVATKARAYYEDHMRPWFQQRYADNTAALRDKETKWRLLNPGKRAATEAKRRAQKVNATPAWADKVKIGAIYEEAAALRALGLDAQVDHIYPLQGRLVSGLHVHNNLQILLGHDNRSKGNRVRDVTTRP